jgi:hypothetical protein
LRQTLPKSRNQIYTDSEVTDIFIRDRISRQELDGEMTQIPEDEHSSPPETVLKRERKIIFQFQEKFHIDFESFH